MLELKLNSVKKGAERTGTLNRTMLELKPFGTYSAENLISALNRTILELKPAKTAGPGYRYFHPVTTP